MTPPRDQLNPSGLPTQSDPPQQNSMRPPIQVPPQEQSDEEIVLVQGIKELKEQIRLAKLREEFRKLQEELHELGIPNPFFHAKNALPNFPQ